MCFFHFLFSCYGFKLVQKCVKQKKNLIKRKVAMFVSSLGNFSSVHFSQSIAEAARLHWKEHKLLTLQNIQRVMDVCHNLLLSGSNLLWCCSARLHSTSENLWCAVNSVLKWKRQAQKWKGVNFTLVHREAKQRCAPGVCAHIHFFLAKTSAPRPPLLPFFLKTWVHLHHTTRIFHNPCKPKIKPLL